MEGEGQWRGDYGGGSSSTLLLEKKHHGEVFSKFRTSEYRCMPFFCISYTAPFRRSTERHVRGAVCFTPLQIDATFSAAPSVEEGGAESKESSCKKCTGAVTYTPAGASRMSLSPQMAEATLDQMKLSASECEPGLICGILVLQCSRFRHV